MKQRISSLDLQILAGELKNSLESYRLNNIYNVSDSTRQFLLRFNKPDSKLNVIVDCGLRIHLTDFNRPIPPAPSGFVVKLRKHLKGKRLTALRQVQNDRILVLQFADGLFYLVLEFFSAGNVILLNEDRTILSLQRIVHEHENKVGETYEMFDESLFLKDIPALQDKKVYTTSQVEEWLTETRNKFSIATSALQEANVSQKKGEKKKKIRVPSIHKLLLSKEPHLSSDLLSKNCKMLHLDPSTSALEFEDKSQKLVELLTMTEDEYHSLLTAKEREGFILAKKNENYNSERDNSDLEYVYETFHPFRPYVDDKNSANTHIIEIDGQYNKTLDNFFSTIESSKYALRIQAQELQAKKKIEDARLENERRIQALVDVQASNEEKGHLIIANADLVEEAKLAIQGLLDQQMDWNTIEKLILSEQRKGNMIAQLIQLPLNLKENKFTVRLTPTQENDENSDESNSSSDVDSDSESDNSSSSDESSDSDVSDFETDEGTERKSRLKSRKGQKKPATVDKNTVKVTIDLGLTAYANASEYFNIKKTSVEKQKRMEKNIEKAMKNIEERVDKQLKKKLKDSHDVLKRIRTPYFFEKYNWFISSEGFLVMMGKNGVETDQIYSKFIEDNDIYMSNHFNTQVWIKNPDGKEVPPNTLMQAGILCMSSSEAWSKKIAASAWWCFAKNVSKFDDVDQSVLSPGVFRLKNEKDRNELPASQLVMGFGFMWKVKTAQSESDHEDETSALDDDNSSDPEDIEEEASPVVGTTEPVEEMLQTIDNDFSDLQVRDDAKVDDSENETDGEDVFDTQTIATNMVENMNRKVRGKKGKLKKMQKKYADQDETERLLRLEALGTLKGLEKQQLKEKEEIAKQQKREYKKAKREKQKEIQALKFTRNEKVHVNYTKFLEELKPTLEKDDEIIDVVPVFAPWPALLKCKYKVKVQPGNAKKTKTMTEILHHFMKRSVDPTENDKESDWPREHEMIKSLKEQDLVLLICVDKLKISLPGQNDTSNKGKNTGKHNKSKSKGRKK
ncbi:hypothetical protein NCAS_0C04050 [Naumovozyma castellii]|uniref:Ribosome quality control complex subunit 2 n=1 Tax=Naumovozyma castellii TaxID=27288 RepID=G0VD33_NAUCA|nr:hypothetical protein NCAS_0C04050 [Naumovozyma castellii CBS 4309]CCC69395.1 hypothetical protein NCAS_0C04050 [Naumovozyma castellii CBS 4309]